MWFVRGAVAALISPLGTTLALGVLAWCLLVLARRRFWRRVGAATGLLALGWLWLWATPVASHALRSTLEAQVGPEGRDPIEFTHRSILAWIEKTAPPSLVPVG